MQVRYRYRCHPTPGQEIALALSQKLYKEGQNYPGTAALQKQSITQAKRTPERSWLGDVSASMLRQSVRDLDKAFHSWWACPSGKHKGVRFPKVGELNLVWSRPLPAAPSSCTIIKDTAGRYFASFVVEVEDNPLPANNKAVGIDLGLTKAVQGYKPRPSGRCPTYKLPEFWIRGSRKRPLALACGLEKAAGEREDRWKEPCCDLVFRLSRPCRGVRGRFLNQA